MNAFPNSFPPASGARIEFQDAADNSPALIWMAGVDGLCNWFNKGWLEFTGRSIEQERGNGWAEGVYADDLQSCIEQYLKHFNAREHFLLEYRLRRYDGQYRWILDSGAPSFDAAGTFLGYNGVCFDITERKKIESVLNEESQRFRSILDNLFAYVALLDINGVVQEVNKAPLERAGYRREDVVGKYFYDAPWWNYDDQVREQLIAAIDSARQGKASRYDVEAKMGNELIPIDFLIAPIYDEAGKVIGLLPTAVDITERKRLEMELHRQARLDYLTGLSNRRDFMERAQLELARTQRYGNALSVLMLDVDNFKKINDSHGHDAGDMVLKSIALTFHKVLRSVDIIGRLGGEEFAVILPETGVETALEVAERLRETISASEVALSDGLRIHFTVSIGAASINNIASNIDTLLRESDRALYKAKLTGKNKVCT
ncbi:GGDEF domain-containing protein [Ferriphaselus sp. R-1]|uniref:sensor domain-containing diguanylate cyclase n=1 Tax=Ferriphaselus sp. R-1 TaxID=1485544 RepID=UPI0006899086|nr:GGDEF domain-containing protein [Ferriphaselus sp. R-1]